MYDTHPAPNCKVEYLRIDPRVGAGGFLSTVCILVSCDTGVTLGYHRICTTPVASFTKEVNPRLAKRPLVFNGRLANRGLTSLIKGATGVIRGHLGGSC